MFDLADLKCHHRFEVLAPPLHATKVKETPHDQGKQFRSVGGMVPRYAKVHDSTRQDDDPAAGWLLDFGRLPDLAGYELGRLGAWPA